MFNRERLKEAVAEYKKCFVQKWWPDEKYKWEMVKCFQVNWDVNADDFAAMLAKSLAKAAAILNAANYYPVGMITEFAEKAQEDVRAMFIALLMKLRKCMSELMLLNVSHSFFLKDMEMVRLSIISMRMLFSLTFGYVILINIIYTN